MHWTLPEVITPRTREITKKLKSQGIAFLQAHFYFKLLKEGEKQLFPHA